MKCQNCGQKEGTKGKYRTKDGLFNREMYLCEDCAAQFESVSLSGTMKRHRNAIIVFLFIIAVTGLILVLSWWEGIHQPPKTL